MPLAHDPAVPARWPRGAIARGRLRLAVAVSIAIHIALLAAVGSGGMSPRAAVESASLAVTLVPLATGSGEPQPAGRPQAPASEPDFAPPPAPAHGRHDAAPAAPPAEPRVPVQAEARYYAVDELDIFPRLAQPLAIDRPAGKNDLDAPMRLRVELLIDADGLVRRIVARGEGGPEATEAAWKLWQHARFDPARKAGRAVASRIEVEVIYEPAGVTR